MTRILWSGYDDVDWSLNCEMTMPLRAPSELSDSYYMYIRVFVRRWTRWGRWCSSSSSYLLLLILRMCSAVEFLTFFGLFLLIIYANLGRSFTVHHRAACRSRENGEGNHQIRVLTQVGVAEKKEKYEAWTFLWTLTNKYEGILAWILIDTIFHGFEQHSLKRRKNGEKDDTFFVSFQLMIQLSLFS